MCCSANAAETLAFRSDREVVFFVREISVAMDGTG
jgi:hypothetical protein